MAVHHRERWALQPNLRLLPLIDGENHMSDFLAALHRLMRLHNFRQCKPLRNRKLWFRCL